MTDAESKTAAACAKFMGWELFGGAWTKPHAVPIRVGESVVAHYVPDYNPAADTPQGREQAHDVLVELEKQGFSTEMGKSRRCGKDENPGWAKIQKVEDHLITISVSATARWPYAAMADAVAKMGEVRE